MAHLHVRAIGEGWPVLILHGGRLDHRHMRDALEPVFSKTQGWRRLYLDLPGCGKSTGFDHVASQDDVLDEIIGYVDALPGDMPLAVIGESRGSYIARGLAYRRAARLAGVALIVPGGDADPSLPLPEAPTLETEADLLGDVEKELKGRAAHLVVKTRSIMDKIRQTKLPAAAKHDAALEARIQDHFAFSFNEQMVPAIFDAPSLIIAGRQDSIAGFDDALQLLRAYPRATLLVADAAGHSVTWERPELAGAMILDWLSRMSAHSQT